jgi:hypothetical protein
MAMVPTSAAEAAARRRAYRVAAQPFLNAVSEGLDLGLGSRQTTIKLAMPAGLSKTPAHHRRTSDRVPAVFAHATVFAQLTGLGTANSAVGILSAALAVGSCMLFEFRGTPAGWSGPQLVRTSLRIRANSGNSHCHYCRWISFGTIGSSLR